MQNNIRIYDIAAMRPDLEDDGARRDIMAEWACVLRGGAGVVVLKGAYADTRVLVGDENKA